MSLRRSLLLLVLAALAVLAAASAASAIGPIRPVPVRPAPVQTAPLKVVVPTAIALGASSYRWVHPVWIAKRGIVLPVVR